MLGEPSPRSIFSNYACEMPMRKAFIGGIAARGFLFRWRMFRWCCREQRKKDRRFDRYMFLLDKYVRKYYIRKWFGRAR